MGEEARTAEATAVQAGPEVFISYHRVTHLAQAEALHQALTARGVAAFKDDRSLRASEHWMEQLGAALGTCRRFVVLLGPRGLERWVGAETSIVLNRHFGAQTAAGRPQIVPVRMPGAPDMATLPFLGLLQGVDWAGDGRPPAALLEALARPLDADSAEGQSPPAEAMLPPEECPWVGLASFQKAQARRFFGRERDVLAALDRIGRAPDSSVLALVEGTRGPAGPVGSAVPYRRWLHIVGGSGAGKSSLMRAGLLPLIEQGALSARTGLDDWIVTEPMLPGIEPLVALAEVLAPALGERSLDLLEKLRSGPPETLRLWLRDALGRRTAGVLLVVDQFEELFTLSPAESRARFDLLLHEALAVPDGPLHLVSTCRSDYQHRIAEDLPRLAGLLNTLTSLYTLTPMGHAGLAQAITAPARLGRLDVAPALVQALLDDADADPAAALPLVQHAMETLWHRRPAGARTLTLADYDTLGRLGGILATEADRLLDSLGDARHASHKGALELLSALAHFHPEGRHTRQSLGWEQACRQAGQGFDAEAQARGQRLIDALAGQHARLRLLTVSGSAADAHSGDTRRVDLIHEALLRCRPGEANRPYWPRLVEYLKAHKDRDLLRQNLRQEAESWQRSSILTCLRDIPNRKQLRRYEAVKFLATKTEQAYLNSAKKPALVKTAVTNVVAGFFLLVVFVELPLQAVHTLIASDAVQDQVMAYRWRHMPPPVPQLVDLPLGEFDYGCKPGRDAVRCPDPEVGRPVDLRRMAAPCTAIGKFEVTQEQYDYFVWKQRHSARAGQAGPSYPELPPNVSFFGWRYGDIPIVNVSYRDAEAYTHWLSTVTGQTWRLPTEEEWEYAARAPGRPGSYEAAYWWGSESPKVRPSEAPRANCLGCDERFSGRIAPVGSYMPNPFGLHDTVGSAWEWTSSLYTIDNRPDTVAFDTDTGRVIRGGGWGNLPEYVRVYMRTRYHPDSSDYGIGFRVCRVSP